MFPPTHPTCPPPPGHSLARLQDLPMYKMSSWQGGCGWPNGDLSGGGGSPRGDGGDGSAREEMKVQQEMKVVHHETNVIMEAEVANLFYVTNLLAARVDKLEIAKESNNRAAQEQLKQTAQLVVMTHQPRQQRQQLAEGSHRCGVATQRDVSPDSLSAARPRTGSLLPILSCDHHAEGAGDRQRSSMCTAWRLSQLRSRQARAGHTPIHCCYTTSSH